MENIQPQNTPALHYITCLEPGDTIFCNHIFEDYTLRLQLLKTLSANVDRDYKTLTDEMPHTPYFDKTIKKVDEASEQLKQAIGILTQELCSEIEEYFSRQYNIEFTPFRVKQDGEIIPLDSYQPLIDNITQQIGNDFISVGRSRIVAQFQKLFQSNEKQPVLKADKIYFPDLISYRSHSETLVHLYDPGVITALLNAISLQVFERTKLPDKAEAKLMHLLRVVEMAVWHFISDDPKISLRFYKNGKLEVQFPTPDAARSFFNAYVLANIIDINSKARQ